MHPRSRRCSSLEYCSIFSVVAPCESGRLVGLGARRDFHHGLLAGQRSATWATLAAYAGPPPRLLALLLGPFVGLGLTAASPAAAQTSLSARILRAEDARELSPDTMAVFSEGLKDPNPRVRAQAVRAMGRFESPALIGQIVPLLADADAGVRQAAAVAAANAAQVFPGSAIEALTKAMATAPPADWAVLAASRPRSACPVPPTSAPPSRPSQQACPPRGCARRSRVPPARWRARPIRCGSKAPRAAWRRSRASTASSRRCRPTPARGSSPWSRRSPERRHGGLVRARRLALLALRNARAVDGELALIAARDPDDEVRRLAMTAVAGGRRARWGQHQRGRSRRRLARRPQGRRAAGAPRGAARLGASRPGARLPAGAGGRGRPEPARRPAGDRPAGRRLHGQRAGHRPAADAGGVAASRHTNRRADLAPVRPCDRRAWRASRPAHRRGRCCRGSWIIPTWQVRLYAARAAGQIAGQSRRWSASAPTRTTTSARPRSRSWCG